MKKMLSSVAVCILMISVLFGFTAYARDFQSIESVDINAAVNADGTVNVKEVWTVTYVGAAADFERSIDAYGKSNTYDLTGLQKYESISDVSVKINNSSVSQADSGNNTFKLVHEDNADSYLIAVTSLSADETKTYELDYTINGAVKKVSGNAVFSFIFIGNSYNATCNNISVNVKLPDGISADSIGITDGEQYFKEQSDSNVKYFAEHVAVGTLGAEITMPKDSFSDGALASYSAAGAALKKAANKLVGILPWVLLAVVIVVVIIAVLFSEVLRRRKYEKEVIKAVGKNSENNEASLPENVTSCIAYKMLVPYSRVKPKATAKKVPFMFALSLLECAEKGYITESNGKLAVLPPKQDLPSYLISTLNFVATFADEIENEHVIDEQFLEKITAECDGNYDVLTKYLMEFYKLIPSVNGKFFKDENNVDLYQKSFAVELSARNAKGYKTYSECFNAVLGGDKTDKAEIYSMMFTSHNADKFFACEGSDSVSVLSSAIGKMYSVYIKSK